MARQKGEYIAPIMGLIGLALAFIGYFGAWVNMPLTGQLPGVVDAPFQSYEHIINIFRWSFLIIIILAAGVFVVQARAALFLFSLIAFIILAVFVIALLFYDRQLIASFMEQSQQRIALQSFVVKHFWPNTNPDYSLNMVTKFEFLWDRILLLWSIMAIGIKTSFLGVTVLMISAVMRVRYSIWIAVTTCSIFVLLFMLLITPLLRANYFHHLGDQWNNTGHYRKALEAYNRSLKLDPMLALSTPFLIKSSRAFDRLESGQSVLGGLYILHHAGLNIRSVKSGRKKFQQITQLRLLIDTTHFNEFENRALEMAVTNKMQEENIRTWVAQGRIDYEDGNYMESLNAFQQALRLDPTQLDVKFYLAHVLLQLDRPNDALALLYLVLPLTWNEQLRADVLCTIGDAYGVLHKPLLARKAYLSCWDFDELFNYRVVRNLGGT